MNEEILNIIKEKGILLEKDIFDIISNEQNPQLAKNLIENLQKVTKQKIITKSTLNKNYEIAKEVVNELPTKQERITIQKVLIKLGINIEIKEQTITINKEKQKNQTEQEYKVFYSETNNAKKIDVQDFVNHFRARYKQLQKILMQRQGLDNLTSINKLGPNRKNLAIIGIIKEKRTTKNKNLIIVAEDLTGQTNILVKADSEAFKEANETQLDDVVLIKGSGNNEIIFAHEILYPEAAKPTKTKFEQDTNIAFISDIHVGSKKFLAEELENFINWLNSENDIAKKIKYLFIIGDTVDGIGVFPGQEKSLQITSLKGQYDELAKYLRKIPKRITMFLCPGQHDASRVPEPQPPIDKKYAEAMHEIENLILVSNPSLIKLIEKEKEFKILMYHGASIHTLINNIEELRMMKAHRTPAKAVKHMLKRRHLAPSHGVSAGIVYVPNPERDPLVIEEVPDILATGEVHRLDVDKHNGILILTGNCWQAQTEFEEKVGNIPDPCKVPVFNLKTHELKILDFTIRESYTN